jgi:hypothetical protein
MNDVELRQRIIGTWSLVSVHYEDQNTEESVGAGGTLAPGTLTGTIQAATHW